MTRMCGPCSLCCKVLGIEELNKPKNVWCVNAKRGHGCVVHETIIPQSCIDFVCMWLEKEHKDGGLREEFRPDKIHAVLTWLPKGSPGICVRVDPGYPNSHKIFPLSAFIDYVRQKVVLVVVVGEHYYQKIEDKWVELAYTSGIDNIFDNLELLHNPGGKYDDA